MTPQQAEELATYWTAAQRVAAAFVRTLVPDFGESEEILQRVAVALVRKFDEYDRRRPFVAWAIGMAKREVMAYRRQRAMDRHIFNDELVERIAESYQRLSHERQPLRELLARCFDGLDLRARRAIDLRYARNLRTLQIADEMHISDAAVRKLLSRARTSLRDCMNRSLDGSKEQR